MKSAKLREQSQSLKEAEKHRDRAKQDYDDVNNAFLDMKKEKQTLAKQLREKEEQHDALQQAFNAAKFDANKLDKGETKREKKLLYEDFKKENVRPIFQRKEMPFVFFILK